jgi:hypothetical protein
MENISIVPNSFCLHAILIVLYHESKLPLETRPPYLSRNTQYVSRGNHPVNTF